MVQVHHDEGVANRIDPESCADAREGIGEALTGERIGQPLSRESTLILGADVVPLTEGNTDGRDNASAQTARRGLRHWHVRTLFAREPGDLMVGQRQHACCTGPRREGEDPTWFNRIQAWFAGDCSWPMAGSPSDHRVANHPITGSLTPCSRWSRTSLRRR